MRDTVYCLIDDAATERRDRAASIEEMVAEVQAYVPGYRLKQKVQFDADRRRRAAPHSPGRRAATGHRRSSVFLEVEGAAHYLPAYAGNLDIMTSAALRIAERSPRSGSTRHGWLRHDRDGCYIQDVTLRDGMHAIRHRHQPGARARRSPRRSTRPGSTPSRSRTATASPARQLNYGFGQHTDWEWIEAVADVRRRTRG